MTEIRVLTVRQPWAWAIIHGGKDVENRVRNIAGDYRGPVAIHVALKEDYVSREQWDRLSAAGLGVGDLDTHGTIIGVVVLVGVHYSGDCYHASIMRASELFENDRASFNELPITSNAGGLIGRASFCSPWAESDGWHLELANPRPLTEPVPFKGALGLRRIDSSLIEGALS